MEAWLEEAYQKIEMMPEDAKQLRALAEEDLFTFAQLVNPGYLYGDVHQEIYKWMQEYTLYGADSQSSNKLIMLPRAHLKSHMVATWCAWVITRHPEVTILYLSATSELAETQLYAIQNILGSTKYRKYWPEYVNPQEGLREKWSTRKISIDHPKRKEEAIRDATISTAGLTTNTTGWHADIIVGDDLVVPENAYTEEGRSSVTKKTSQFTSIRNVGGFTMACGTRYHPADVYASWKKQKYRIYDEQNQVVEERPVWEIKEYKVETEGEFIWPRRVRGDGKAYGFDMNSLSRIRSEYEDRVQFHAQYYNDPNDAGSERISKDKFQYYDRKYITQENGNWYFKGNRLNVFAAVDFAFSLTKKADFTAIVVVGVDGDGNYYVLDIARFKTDRISEYFKEIKELHRKWEFRKLRAEITVAQRVIVRELKDEIKKYGLRLSIEDFLPIKNKEERISAILEPKYDNFAIWHYKGGYIDVLEEELILARPAHDDVKDALASAIEIAVKPKYSRREEGRNYNNVVKFNNRFGGGVVVQ